MPRLGNYVTGARVRDWTNRRTTPTVVGWPCAFHPEHCPLIRRHGNIVVFNMKESIAVLALALVIDEYLYTSSPPSAFTHNRPNTSPHQHSTSILSHISHFPHHIIRHASQYPLGGGLVGQDPRHSPLPNRLARAVFGCPTGNINDGRLFHRRQPLGP